MSGPDSASGQILSHAKEKSRKLATELQHQRVELQREGLSADLDLVQGAAALDDVIEAVRQISQALDKA
jgi:hypothetical protein